MSNRFDQIFSLERLRQHWQTNASKVSEPASTDATVRLPEHIGAELNRLGTIIDQRFPEKDRAGLGILLAELSRLLTARFQMAADHDAVVDDGNPDAAIMEILNQMEDLAEALLLDA